MLPNNVEDQIAHFEEVRDKIWAAALSVTELRDQIGHYWEGRDQRSITNLHYELSMEFLTLWKTGSRFDRVARVLYSQRQAELNPRPPDAVIAEAGWQGTK